MTGTAGLTGKALDLYRAVVLRSSRIDEQRALLISQADKVGASTKDVEAVRAFLLRDHVKECKG